MTISEKCSPLKGEQNDTFSIATKMSDTVDKEEGEDIKVVAVNKLCAYYSNCFVSKPLNTMFIYFHVNLNEISIEILCKCYFFKQNNQTGIVYY